MAKINGARHQGAHKGKPDKICICIGGPHDGKVVKILGGTQEFEIYDVKRDANGDPMKDALGIPIADESKRLGKYSLRTPKGSRPMQVMYWHQVVIVDRQEGDDTPRIIL